MTQKSITANMATDLSMDQEVVEALTRSLVTTIKEQIAAGNGVAVPGFGQFVPVTYPEKIVNDLSTGKRMMLPPVIEIEFTAAPALTKELCK